MLDYPLTLSFKRFSLGPQINVTDASGQPVLRVKQRALAFKERVGVFKGGRQRQLLYEIRADRVLDFSASYAISTPSGMKVGLAGRQG